jgi:polyisoprenoid-binding protein YceI
MKKLFLLFLLTASIISQAQKIYQTKSGKIKFFSTTPVEDIEATNSQVDAKLATNGQMVFQVAIRGFRFDNSLMEEHFNENYMDSKKFPKAVFMGNIIEINSVDFTKDGTYKVTVKGNLEIHGVKKEITAPGTITIKGGKINSKSVFKITVTDYGIKGGLIGQKIASTVEVTVDCKYD